MARSAAARALLLAALAVCASAASVSYVFCTVGMNATNDAGCVAVPNAGTCTSTPQPVDGNCYCGSPATGAGCLKFSSVSASAVSASIWNTTNNCAGAASLTWGGLPTTNLCTPSDQSIWFVMSAVPTSAGARAATAVGRPGWVAALAVLLLAAVHY